SSPFSDSLSLLGFLAGPRVLLPALWRHGLIWTKFTNTSGTLVERFLAKQGRSHPRHGVAAREEFGDGQQLHDGVSKQEHHNKSRYGGESKRESESSHVAHSYEIQNHCRQNVHKLRHSNGPFGPIPAIVNR